MKIYFAHPAFTEDQRDFKARFLDALDAALTKKCEEREAPVPEIVDPFDFTPGVEDMPPARKAGVAGAVASVCCRLLRDCFLVLAVADDADTGVAFELGFAFAHGIPTILVSHGDAADHANAMLTGTSRACIPHVLRPENMAMLADLIHGLSASEI
jgi:nucleoside 2-deoxyribosyltransferase